MQRGGGVIDDDTLIEQGLRLVWMCSSPERRPLLAELDMLGWSRFPQTKVEGLIPHRHRGYEICYIVDGAADWWVGKDERYTVHRGDVFITRPGERHGGVDTMMHPCELYWLQIFISDNAPLPGLSSDEERALADALARITRRHFPGSADIASLFGRLVGAHCPESLDADAIRIIAARASLHALLVQTIRDHDAAAEAGTGIAYSGTVRRGIEYMESRIAEPFQIDEVARSLGLSPARFYERFLHEVGQTPTDWRVRRRVEEAKQRLSATDDSVTDIATSLGFTSSQYFATAFKKYTGRTPSEYRRQQKTGEFARLRL